MTVSLYQVSTSVYNIIRGCGALLSIVTKVIHATLYPYMYP